MIHFTNGNLLQAQADALVNTVNTVGYMGKGIALQFRKTFPTNFSAYQSACRKDEVQTGKMFVVPVQSPNTKYIINFPTKQHWKGNSKIEFVIEGLKDLVKVVCELELKSIAIPPLGCGLGGLQWSEVRPLIHDAFATLPHIDVFVYEPGANPNVINNTPKPKMTFGRSAVIKIMDRYIKSGFLTELTHLEIQKICYFLQEAGSPLRLNFQKNIYGPYADNLRLVLSHLDGHYLSGYKDGSASPNASFTLIGGAVEDADEFLAKAEQKETVCRIAKVTDLIEGFESPLAMETLATVHYVAKMKSFHKETPIESIVSEVHAWSKRKQNLMKPFAIKVSWQRLSEQNWI